MHGHIENGEVGEGTLELETQGDLEIFGTEHTMSSAQVTVTLKCSVMDRP